MLLPLGSSYIVELVSQPYSTANCQHWPTLRSKHITHAFEIVNHLFNCLPFTITQAHPSLKLPLVYLMDSILKNVGKNYIPAFQKNLIATFTNAFSQVSSADKEKLKVLIMTPWSIYFALDPYIEPPTKYLNYDCRKYCILGELILEAFSFPLLYCLRLKVQLVFDRYE